VELHTVRRLRVVSVLVLVLGLGALVYAQVPPGGFTALYTNKDQVVTATHTFDPSLGQTAFLLGANTRCVPEADVINVACAPYNARCDGVTNDAPAINAAVAAAEATGGVVQLPAGTCQIESSIEIGATLTFRGRGRGRSILRTSSNITLLNVDTPITAPAIMISDLTIEDLTLQGAVAVPDNNLRGIRLRSSHSEYYTTIRRVRVIDTVYGMSLAGQVGYDKQWLHISDNFFGANQGPIMKHGIYNNARGTGTIIANNMFSFRSGSVSGAPPDDGTAIGYEAEQSSFGDTVIVGNHFEGGKISIKLTCLAPYDYCANFIVTGNKFDSAAQNIVASRISFSRFVNNNGSYNAPIDLDASSVWNTYDLNKGLGLSLVANQVKIGDTAGEFLKVIGKDGNTQTVVADFAASQDLSDQRSCIRLHSTNPAYYWDWCVEDQDGGGMQNGLAVWQHNDTFSTTRRFYIDVNGAPWFSAFNTASPPAMPPGARLVCVDPGTGKLYASHSNATCN
jgi:hypothetical protein